MPKEVSPQNEVSVVEQDIAALQERKTQALEFTNPNTYVRARVFQYRDKWWEDLDRMRTSEDKDERKCAMIEFNKLQCRVLPTQLENGDSSALTVQVMNYSGGSGTKDKENAPIIEDNE
jgi:hypothetical protein